MSLFDLINKAQASVDQLQKKAEDWQAKANQFANGLGMSATDASAPVTNNEITAVADKYTCPICGNHQEHGKKNTAYGEICANCVQALKDKGISPREAKRFTKEQIYGLCDPAVNAMDAVRRFAITNSPVALKADEHCFYAGRACGGRVKTITTGYTGANKGYSLRLMKNFTYHSGGSVSQAVRQRVLDMSPQGTFVITSNRFILLTTQYGFEIPGHKVSNIELHTDAITIYAGNKSHIVMTNDVKQIAFVVNLLSAATEEYERKKAIEESTPKATRTRRNADAPASGADEIRKYRQLADEGIITEEEFEKKKRDILGL